MTTTNQEPSSYSIWWVFIIATRVKSSTRKALKEKLGFTAYPNDPLIVRHCPSRERAEEIREEAKATLKEGDSARILLITDKQFGDMQSVYGSN